MAESVMANWSNLAMVTYFRTYSRQDDKSKPPELWEDSIERAITGNVRDHNVSEKEIERLRYFGLERKAHAAGRGIWFSGAPAHELFGGVALNNPLHEDTKILTKELGWVPLKDIEGKKVKVLSNTKLYARNNTQPNPIWVDANVSYSEQHPCMRMTYEDRYGISTTITASLNHRWFVLKNTKSDWKRITTEELKEGFWLPKTTPCKHYDLSIEGAKHGFFFGDGTRSTGDLNQFGIENVTVSRKLFHQDQFRSNYDDKAVVKGCPLAWGKVPEAAYLNDAKYLYGFLAGYFAADGHMRKTNGEMRLHSARKKELEWTKELFRRLGIATSELKLESTSSNFKEHRELWCIYISPSDLNEKFFLKDSHREIWGKFGKPKRNHLKITKLEKLQGLHRVLCATVPHYEQFVIEGFCLTSNCWALTADDWYNFVIAQDLLMLGGGVGLSVEHRFVSKLSKVKKDVVIIHRPTKDANFIVPDSREGWCELLRRVFEAFFMTGKGFTYSTVCIRGANEDIKGFGGKSSGPQPLVAFIEKLCALLITRQGKHIRPIDAADIVCLIGEMVKAGNIRRSAIIILGDAWDKEYLRAKRWDLGPIPTQRSNANFSIICDDIEDVHASFWKTYEHGEPFGIVNRKNIQKFGRMGEKMKDSAILVNPCAEATLDNGEACNLQETFLPNLKGKGEFKEGAILMHRWGKRVSCEHYHHDLCNNVIKRNRRIGTGITGCLQSDLFDPGILDWVYAAIQKENVTYSKKLGIPESIRTTVVKPSGTVSKVGDIVCEGLHPAYSRHIIQTIRFDSESPLLPFLRAAGHKIEPEIKMDGTLDHKIQVVEFYVKAPDNAPCADEGHDTWKQLEDLKLAQKHWSDQAVSVTIYYKKEEIPRIKEWLRVNLKEIKTISFLLHQGHGFKQAPKQKITAEEYEKGISKLTPLEFSQLANIGEVEAEETCPGGACPVK